MANNVLISIEQENKTEAEFMSRSFVDKSIKNRAYVNALGAELVIKYLNENGVDTEELHNIHSISKILERVDLADILLPNIHIDARVVFDEDKIFIPKTHFELHIQPDIYVVAKKDIIYDIHSTLMIHFDRVRNLSVGSEDSTLRP